MAEEHIYRKFDEDLEDIRANVIQMGAIIEEQIRNAIQSLEQIDPQLAQKVINRDEDVNDLETLIEEECSLFIAKRAPQAKDLRNVRRIEAEVHNFDNTHNLQDFLKMLDEANFEYTYEEPREGILIIHGRNKNFK